MATDPFFMMPNWFFDDGHLTAMGVNTFAVYMILRRHSNSQSHECNPSYSSIQKKARIGRTAISGAINYLAQNGYIEIVKTGDATQSSNVYKVFPFDKIKGNQSHLGLVSNKTSPKKQPQPVPYGTETSPNQDWQLVPYGTLNIQTKNIQIEKDKEEKEGGIFFSDSPNQNQAMEQEKIPAAIANKQDPAPLPPAPLSDAAAELKAKFEGRFERKTKAQWWERYVKPTDDAWRELLTDWAFSETSRADFKESLLMVQMDHLRKLSSPCERGNAINSLSNYIKNDDLTSFQVRVDAAIAYEEALKANEAAIASVDEPEPRRIESTMTINGAWAHFYPRSAKVGRNTGTVVVFWDIEGRFPPPKISDRCIKFLEERKSDREKLQALLNAKHEISLDKHGYPQLRQGFNEDYPSLVEGFNQQLQKLLQAA